MKKRFILFGLLAGSTLAIAEDTKLRYVNPLTIEDTRSIADPTVLRFQGKYYLFLSGGFTWSSDDLVHWKHQPATMPAGSRVTAPAAFEYQGYVYLTGNDTGLFRSRHPVGPWEYIGDFEDDQGMKMLLFVTMVFVDGDGRVYAYYSGRHTDGIYGVELDRKDLTHFAAPPKKLWTFNSAHIWERYGDNNEGTQLSWLEALWMTKRNGKYYLQIFRAGHRVEKTYAVGVYTAKSPLGPFTYAPRNPILVHQNGTGSMGPDTIRSWKGPTAICGPYTLCSIAIGAYSTGASAWIRWASIRTGICLSPGQQRRRVGGPGPPPSRGLTMTAAHSPSRSIVTPGPPAVLCRDATRHTRSTKTSEPGGSLRPAMHNRGSSSTWAAAIRRIRIRSS